MTEQDDDDDDGDDKITSLCTKFSKGKLNKALFRGKTWGLFLLHILGGQKPTPTIHTLVVCCIFFT